MATVHNSSTLSKSCQNNSNTNIKKDPVQLEIAECESDDSDSTDSDKANKVTESKKIGEKKMVINKWHKVLLLMLCMILSGAALTFVIVNFYPNDNEDTPKATLNKFSTVYNVTNNGVPFIIAPNHLRIVPRSEWLAQPPEAPLDVMTHPTPWVIIAHTAAEPCESQSECILRVRLIQNYHVESRGWYDIGYNFLVGGDGSAYYGRGWDYVGAHTKGYNNISIGISFIGTFNKEAPPQQQLDACMKLIALGVKEGKIAKDYKLLAHRQLMSTRSPGDKLYEILKTWPHFVHENTNVQDILPKRI
ncbi:Peptidoglycan-recognition protein LE [Eumeta japonica]|uniref:Peptidoglycan recognition protein n=1 Tax=Eumeta variegata TaxID=151549 RepID=A0A4C2A082_EUMVA|nr:Peptidoglycan-recognition protein LE [Eumeta japonica]